MSGDLPTLSKEEVDQILSLGRTEGGNVVYATPEMYEALEKIFTNGSNAQNMSDFGVTIVFVTGRVARGDEDKIYF